VIALGRVGPSQAAAGAAGHSGHRTVRMSQRLRPWQPDLHAIAASCHRPRLKLEAAHNWTCCVYWRGEERDDWLEQQRASYERVITEDSHEAEPALRLLAGEGRELLRHWV
jgi:hypothetical protein